MTEDHWKHARMSALLWCGLLSLLLMQLEGCNGQGGSVGGGSNFFYYFSPTQKTMVNQGAAVTPGNIFNSPLLNLNQQQIQPTFSSQQQSAFPNLQFSSPATPLLGYHQHQTPASTFFSTQHPIGNQFQFPQFPQPNLIQPNTAFSTFSRFGQDLFANPALGQQAYIQSSTPTPTPQLPQQPQQPGGLSFFESPFQFVQQRYLQTPPTAAVPVQAPEQPPPPTTAQPDTVTTSAPKGRRKQKISSRFRYIQPQPQPAVQYHINPYNQIVTPINSVLPYTEQRYYSTVVPSAPTPTGYSFSLGGDQSTSSVHVSLGPLTNKIQQHLTEITNLRRIASQPRKQEVYADQIAVEQQEAQKDAIVSGSTMQSHDVQPATSEQSPVLPELPAASSTPAVMVVPTNMSTTVETLLNEPSFQHETIAAPADPVSSNAPPSGVEVSPDATAKINAAKIPRRLAIRHKVARKRLRLDGTPEPDESEVNQGRSVDGGEAVPVPRRRGGGRRRLSQNRLSGNEPGKEYQGSQKGVVEESSPESISVSSTTLSPQTPAPSEQPPQPQEEVQVPDVAPPAPEQTVDQQPPQEAVPSSVSSTTEHIMMMTPSTPAPPVEAQPADPVVDEQGKNDEYYYDEYDTPSGQQPNAIHENPAPALKIETPSDADPSSDSGELPISNNIKKEDYPTVFRDDNSVETDKGEIITRYKSSEPAPKFSTSSTTTTTTEATPEPFVKSDPAEEQPPQNSEELEVPVFQPLSTTEHSLVTPGTPSSFPVLSTTESTPVPSDDDASDSSSSSSSSESESHESDTQESMEDEHEVDSHEPEHPSSSSSTTEPPMENEQLGDAVTLSSTEAAPQQELVQPASPEDSHDVAAPMDTLSSSMSPVVEGSSSTTEEIPMQLEERDEIVSSSTEPSVMMSSSTSTESPVEDDAPIDDQTISSSTTLSPLPSPATQEDPPAHAAEEDFPHSEELPEHSGEEPEGNRLSSEEEIGKAQRLALEESLRRLRERQQTTESVEGVPGEAGSPNGTSSDSETDGRTGRKLRNFVRKPVQIANQTLPTTGPLQNINAVLDDGEGEHQSRNQVIEKIQRFRSSSRRVITTTKRPRRVTRPSSSTERLPLNPDLDSYSDSSSSTSGPVEKLSTYPTPVSSSTSAYSPIITTTPEPSSAHFTSTTEAVTTVEPTTTTTTPSPEILTTTPTFRDRARARGRQRTTFFTTTTPSTTTLMTLTDDFFENDDMKTVDNEDDHVYYDEGYRVDDSSSSTDSSSTTVASRHGSELYTTPSTTTTSTTTTEKGPYITTIESVERIEPEFSTEQSSTTTSTTTTTTEMPVATTTIAGQLIIHEILPTMPPLKEVRFVIGESVEDEQVIQSDEKKSSEIPKNAEIVRVETKVKVSSSVGGSDEEEPQQSSSVQITSDEASYEDSPSATQETTSVEQRNGRRVRVVIRRQRQRQPNNGTGTAQESQRRRRKVLHRQLRRPT